MEAAEAMNHQPAAVSSWNFVSAKPDHAPAQAAAFAAFSPAVKTRWDEQFLYIESNGMPAHGMMTGITAWQQQVPLPQAYAGSNAWRIPLHPVVAQGPLLVKDRFLRGAIAIAANGIPIFNPQNNRGEISTEIGELDQWGGHCGRADDYHYHITPLHLQKQVGQDQPVAYALDGYPIFGLTEPDGSTPTGLDALHGHDHAALGYHYHASETYPYIIGGFHGEVTEREGQVDPQPRAQPVREALKVLRGAKITGFESPGADRYKLSYTVNGEPRGVSYQINPDGSYPFEFNDGREGIRKEVYTSRPGGGEVRPPRERATPEGNPPAREGEPDRPSGPRAQAFTERPDQPRSSNGTFFLSSPAVEDKAMLPVEFTGDGAALTPPLEWKGVPAGTQSFALIMDHTDPEGQMKWYWTLYNIPAEATSIAKNDPSTGKQGTGFKGNLGYEPPHSRGPGAKTYVITLYALSAPLQTGQPAEVNRESLLKAMKGKVLASSSLRVVYTSKGNGDKSGPPRRSGPPPPRPDPPPAPAENIKEARATPLPALPNFLFILTDDQAWSGTPVAMLPGNEASRTASFHMPNLERLASRGVIFSQAYAAHPKCECSRAALLMGRSTTTLNATDKRSQQWSAPPGDSMVNTLKRANPSYRAAHFGKWQWPTPPEKFGYDASDGITQNEDGDTSDPLDPKQSFGITRRAEAFMQQQVQDGHPFYLQLSYYAPHNQPQALAATLQKYGGDPASERKGGGKNSPLMAAMTEDLDTCIGAAFNKLDELGIAQNTFIIYMSDNGGKSALLKGGKTLCDEGGLRVPLIVSGPGVRRRAYCPVPVISYDLFPTMIDYIAPGYALPKGVEGGSWKPLLTNEGADNIIRPIGNMVWHHDVEIQHPQSALRQGDFKLLHYWDTREDFLYDLSTDLGESHNLAASQPEVAAKLLTELKTHILSGLGGEKFNALENLSAADSRGPGAGKEKATRKGQSGKERKSR
jgi:Raf kinase inhibitor-like YbhB/YbcL family protein